LQLIRSYRIKFYFFRFAVARTSEPPPTLLRGKLAVSPVCLLGLPRYCRATCPGNGTRQRRLRNGKYGHGFYSKGYGNCYGNGFGNGNVMLETSCYCTVGKM